MTSTGNHRSISTSCRVREPVNFSYIEPFCKDDIQLVWIDRRYREESLGHQLQETHSLYRFFDNLTLAVEYLSNKENRLQFFVITSGEFSEEIVKLSESLDRVQHLFIYCYNIGNYEYLRNKSSKLIVICSSPSELIKSIEWKLKSPSVLVSRQSSMRDLSESSATFIWFQVLKSLLKKLTDTDEELAMNDLKEIVRNFDGYREEKRAKLLRELSEYHPDQAIRLYSSMTSLSTIINDALRQQDIDLLYKCRHFIRDLSNQLTNLSEALTKPLTVYRGVSLSIEDFSKVKHIARPGALVSTCGYLSTSMNRHVAEMFAGFLESGASENGSISIMYEIAISQGVHVIAGNISPYSANAEEDEVLFDIDSTFEVTDINVNEAQRSCTICMQTSNYARNLKDRYLRYNETQLDRLSVELLFGRLMTDMGEFDKSIKYFERLVGRQNIDQVHVQVNLGRAHAVKDDFENASKHYEAAEQLEPDRKSRKMADILHKIGLLDYNRGNYTTAIEKYRQSLDLYNKNQISDFWEIKGDLYRSIALAQTMLGEFDEAEQTLNSANECIAEAGLPPDHEDLSQYQMNYGKMYQRKGMYDKAEEHYATALKMRKRRLPPGHLDIAVTLYRLGSVIGEAGNDYERALEYFRESLVLTENAVGQYHSQRAFVLSGIGNVYLCRNELDLASTYQYQVLELYQKVYDNRDHEDIARTYNNIGELCRRKKEYKNAFAAFEKALEIRRRVLPDDHFDIGTVYVNLGETYSDIGDYKTALEHVKKGITLWEKKLVPSATYMDEAKAVLVELTERLSQANPT